MGVLDGLKVLDLSWGISGPVAGMLLADHGASVTKIEPPDGDPLPGISGYPVWNRGKRSAVLDSERPSGQAAPDRARQPGRRPHRELRAGRRRPARHRLRHGARGQSGPRLLLITGYGTDGPDAGPPGHRRAGRRPYRPAVRGPRAHRRHHRRAVRHRGHDARPGGTRGMLGRPGPGGTAVHRRPVGRAWRPPTSRRSAINAAIRARGITGRGQHVSASLLQGVLATTLGGWQQVEHPDAPNFETWVIDPRAPEGLLPRQRRPLDAPLGTAARSSSSTRRPDGMQAAPDVGLAQGRRLAGHHRRRGHGASCTPTTTSSPRPCAQYPPSEWVQPRRRRSASRCSRSGHRRRRYSTRCSSPTAASSRSATRELGPIRQVGRVVELSRHPQPVPAGAAPRGEHTAAVIGRGRRSYLRGGERSIPPYPPETSKIGLAHR